MSETTSQSAAQPQSLAIVSWEPATATEAWALAKYYGGSALIPRALKNTADVFVTIAAGRDFGWSPMQSMRGIYVVEGKPSLSADAMVGLAKKSSLCEYFVLVESSAAKATYECKRKGDPGPVKMTFTIEEAQAAGLTSKDGPWKAYPARMLRNRCKSALCKEVFEELFFGVYEESEIEEVRQPVRRQAPMLVQEPPPSAAPASSQVVEMVREPAREEPPHDAVTGEVVEPEPVSMAEVLSKKIASAADHDALVTVAKEIKQAADLGIISAESREALRPLYDARRKAVLVGGAA